MIWQAAGGPVLAGLLFLALGIAAWRGALRRNSLAGIRTLRTLSSDAAWRAAHRAAAPVFVGYGAASVVVGAVLLALGPAVPVLARSVIIVVWVLCLVPVIVTTTRRAERAAEQAERAHR